MPAVLRQHLRELRRGNIRLTGLHDSAAAVRAYGALRSVASRVGLQVVVKSFYSPIPDLSTLSDDVWGRRSELAGIELDLDTQLALLERDLRPYLAEFRPPRERPDDGARFYLNNPSYGPGDAETLYAFVRHGKPRRVVELGSGFTTLVLADAARANAAEGVSTEVRAFDPYPRVVSEATTGVSLVRTPAETVPLDVFDALDDGDVLVVDTTHVVKLGGDVNRIVLDILPRLRPGVRVHFHDIFLPHEYPREWAERFGLYWTEQYLLQAFLSLNDSYRVECSLHALTKAHPGRLAALIPSLAGGASPAAFWIRRTQRAG